MTYVTSDLHGYPLQDFMRLLDRVHFSGADDLIVIGDVIDRNGDGGIAMLRWMLQHVNVRMILGNHEAMLLSCRFLFDTITDESLAKLDKTKMELLSVWMMNGAEPTMKALRDLFREDEETARELLDYLEDTPLYDMKAAVYHVGGTSVPGMAGKQIIDILVCPESTYAPEALAPALESLGYTNLGECGRPGRLFLVRGDRPLETFYLHLFM